MPTTIKDVAARVGVSSSTVSRVLNDRPGISPRTRERVLQAAQELNYSPSMAARSLATTRTYNVGYIGYKYGAPPANLRLSNVAFGTLQGVDEELTKHGYHVLTTYVDEEAVKSLDVPDMIPQGRVDGLILNGPAIRPRFILQLQNMGLPIVLVDNLLNETAIDCILCDNEGGAYQVVKHLIGHGHEQIVFLSGPAHWLSSRERAAGYRRALREAKLEPRVLFMPNTIVDTGRQTMLAALEEHPDLTAVVAVNDATAIGAIQSCQQAGRIVPDEVAVVGFDDEPWAQMHTPALTTVRINWHEIGVQAARRVVDLIERDNQVPLQIRLAVELIVRQSCGCHAEINQKGGENRHQIHENPYSDIG
ncbi:MAG: LacI family DNA-binding transcriptional regulator [Chloroflexota bacterium]|nr:LacI family DNA-binding transcriptional regulator [Chloroflexota bacterium]